MINKKLLELCEDNLKKADKILINLKEMDKTLKKELEDENEI